LMRKKEAGLDFANVTKLDLILVSHAHMDHMSLGTLEMMSDKFPGCPVLFPEGDENYLPNFDLNMVMVKTGLTGIKPIGEPVYIDSIKITPVYAYHPGGRYLLDSYSWKIRGATGYIIQYRDVCIYFAGDTGYDEFAFKKMGSEFKIDLAFIPIGPCRNCDSSGIRYHASSVEALQILEDLNAKYMIPIHYGALSYFSEPNLPKEYLEKIVHDPESHYHYLNDRIKILTEGEQIVWKQ
jgi:N-acyl-phosphatidylethanolamine-hydrolysing phospholipase D